MSKISFTLKLGYKLFNIKSIRIKTKSSYLYSIKTRRNSFQKHTNTRAYEIHKHV